MLERNFSTVKLSPCISVCRLLIDIDLYPQVSNSIQTQTYVENVAIATMVDMEEGLTKTVTLSPAETATITKEQLAKIQV